MNIQGAVALVTGGASGLGEATVRRLVGNGAKAVIIDMQADKGKALADELGDGVEFAQTDVTNPEEVDGAIQIASSLGPLRIAVNCAGIGWATRTIGRDGSPHDLDIYRKVIEVNTIGTFNVLSRAAGAMSQTDPLADNARGVIVNTASVAAFDGQIGQIAYATSKAAVVGMTLPAARDLAPVGVRVCTIAPGTMDTPMLALLPDDQRQALVKDVMFPKRLGTADDFARLVEAIVTNDYLNGETIRLDGGLRMPPK
ncbi:MAG TPA: SDR family NAD(P)-dependent oxidoreductase [Acidimicrobiia bacterium]|nr:SDR family NAD(P)-dependent oxidoreductase [Acidimicrobiia bacterium]